MKICQDCEFTKEYSEFSKSSRNKDGHLNICKSCVNKRKKEKAAPQPTDFGKKYKQLLKKCRHLDNVRVLLSEKDYTSIASSPSCYFCEGVLTGDGLLVSRVNMNKQYSLANTVPCCHKCSLLIENFEHSDAQSRIEKVFSKIKK